MPRNHLPIGEEIGAKKTFVWAIDWPGWSRGAKTPELARDALAAYAPRYAIVAREAGLTLPDVDAADLDVVDSVTGGAGTDFGVPSAITDGDRRKVTNEDALRLAAIVEAAWRVFDRVAAAAPAMLRKGPRGGGRDRDKMIDHVLEADHAYAREIGLRPAQATRGDEASIRAERDAILALLRTPNDGGPLNGRRWTSRYAARRIAWHALDHAWEMEDRSEPE